MELVQTSFCWTNLSRLRAVVVSVSLSKGAAVFRADFALFRLHTSSRLVVRCCGDVVGGGSHRFYVDEGVVLSDVHSGALSALRASNPFGWVTRTTKNVSSFRFCVNGCDYGISKSDFLMFFSRHFVLRFEIAWNAYMILTLCRSQQILERFACNLCSD